MTRLAQGGIVDRSRPLRFRFNGKSYQGFAGDTLASALIANNVRIVAGSFDNLDTRFNYGLRVLFVGHRFQGVEEREVNAERHIGHLAGAGDFFG